MAKGEEMAKGEMAKGEMTKGEMTIIHHVSLSWALLGRCFRGLFIFSGWFHFTTEPRMSLLPLNRADRNPALLYCSAATCPYCKSTRPEIKEAAHILGSVVPVYEIDSERERDIVSALRIQGFPTILFRNRQGRLEEYKGARKGRDIADWVCAHSGECGRSSRA